MLLHSIESRHRKKNKTDKTGIADFRKGEKKMGKTNCYRVCNEKSDREHLTPNESDQRDLQSVLINAVVQVRNEQGISQRELEKLSGVSQPVIARIEKGKTTPQIDTLIKVLAAMGKTLAVVPLKTSRAARE